MLATGPRQGQSRGDEPAGSLAAASRTGAWCSAWRAAGDWPAVAAAALLPLLLYRPTLGFGLVFDDHSLVAADGGPVWMGPAWMPYRPLRHASFLLDRALGGSDFVHHAVNVLLLAGLSVLLLLLARRMGASRMAALVAALFAAMHPLAVEAAAYVSGRRDLLCACFGLGSLLLWRSGHRGGGIACLLASAASKETGLFFVVPLLALTAAWPDAAGTADGQTGAAGLPQRGPAMRGAAAMLASAVTSGVLLVLAYGATGPWLPALDAAGLARSGETTLHYLSGLLGLRRLVPEYPLLGAAAAGQAWLMLLPAVLVAATTVAGAACLRAGRLGKGRDSAVVAAWIAAALLALATGGSLHEPGADRHALALLPGVGLAAALLLDAARSGPWRAAAALLAMVAVAGEAGATSRQLPLWRDDRSLWQVVATLPGASPRAHLNLARVFAGEGNEQAAREHVRAARLAARTEPEPWMARAALRCAMGHRRLALRDVERAVHLGTSAARAAQLVADCDPGLAGTPHRLQDGRPRSRQASTHQRRQPRSIRS